MQNVIRQSELAEKFVVRFVAQLLECRQVRRTVSEASGAVNHRVNTMSIGRLVGRVALIPSALTESTANYHHYYCTTANCPVWKR